MKHKTKQIFLLCSELVKIDQPKNVMKKVLIMKFDFFSISDHFQAITKGIPLNHIFLEWYSTKDEDKCTHDHQNLKEIDR